jgi:hypothetical protein
MRVEIRLEIVDLLVPLLSEGLSVKRRSKGLRA